MRPAAALVLAAGARVVAAPAVPPSWSGVAGDTAYHCVVFALEVGALH